MRAPNRHQIAHRTGTAIVAGLLLAVWVGLATGVQGLLAITAATAAAGIIWRNRRRRDVLAAAALLGLAVAAPVAAALYELSRPDPRQAALAALTGLAVCAPIPVLLLWSLPPLPMRRTATAAAATAVTVAAAAVVAVAPFNPSFVTIAAALSASALVILVRRSCARRLIGALQHADGDWVDLGSRRIPSGGPVDRLLVGHGNVVGIWYHDGADPSAAIQTRALNRAAKLAAALRVPPAHVQPVLVGGPADAAPRRTLVNTGAAATHLVLVGREQLPDVLAAAPRRWRPTTRRLALAAAQLDEHRAR